MMHRRVMETFHFVIFVATLFLALRYLEWVNLLDLKQSALRPLVWKRI